MKDFDLAEMNVCNSWFCGRTHCVPLRGTVPQTVLARLVVEQRIVCGLLDQLAVTPTELAQNAGACAVVSDIHDKIIFQDANEM